MRKVSELLRLEGRVALVTGGAGHVGRAAGQALAEQGATVVLADLGEEACLEAARAISERERAEVYGYACDIRTEAGAKALMGRVIGERRRLDILVHCASLTAATPIPGYAVPFDKQTAESWSAALDVNLSSLFWMSLAGREALAANGVGSIIGISSIYGLVGPNLSLYEGTAMGNPAAYAASKGGTVQLIRYLSTVLAPRVRANTIAPGGLARGQDQNFVARYEKLTPMGRMGSEEDLKGAIALLASDASAWITGQCLAVDGGWTAW